MTSIVEENLNGRSEMDPPVSTSHSPKSDDALWKKKMKRRELVAREIVETENSYLDTLKALVDLYILPLKHRTGSAPVLKPKHIDGLFSNAETLVKIHEDFLKDLKIAWSDWSETTMLGDLFKKFAPFFKMYTLYADNNAYAFDLLDKLLKDSKYKEFQNFDRETSQNPRCKGQNLASFIISPIQRIPRYKLLLKELLKTTPETHADHEKLEEALEIVGKVALHVNDAILKSENRRFILRIQDEMVGNVDLVTPSREFVRKGNLLRITRKGDREYMFYLFNDLLVYASKRGWLFKINRMIPIDPSFCIDDLADRGNQKNRWKIISKQKSFVCIGSDSATKASWLKDLQQCIDQQKQKLSYLSEKNDDNMNSSAPVWVQDEDQPQCSLCLKDFSFFRRRHHCRKCGQIYCHNCSKNRVKLPDTNKNESVRCYDQLLYEKNNVSKSSTRRSSIAILNNLKKSQDDEKLEFKLRKLSKIGSGYGTISHAASKKFSTISRVKASSSRMSLNEDIFKEAGNKNDNDINLESESVKETIAANDLLDNWVWLPHNEHAFVPARLSSEGNKKFVFVTYEGEVVEKDISSLKKMTQASQNAMRGDIDNFVFMADNEFDVGPILHQLRVRYKSDKIYTYLGGILVSINPFRQLPIYTADVLNAFKDFSAGNIAKQSPHIFGIAAEAYRGIVVDKIDQSLVISGESGSGKTDASKLIVSYLVHVNFLFLKQKVKCYSRKVVKVAANQEGSHRNSYGIESQLAITMPLLESFGNAKTIANGNSSRFGKWMLLMFKEGKISCGKISHFLLERSRIVKQASNERNFHIFYQVCEASMNMDYYADSDFKADFTYMSKLGLKGPQHFNYLSQSGCYNIGGVVDAQQLKETLSALKDVGFKLEQRQAIIRTIAIILHLGNLNFAKPKNEGGVVTTLTKNILDSISKLLGTSSATLLKSLTHRNINVERGNVVEIPLSLKETLDARDALAKALYSKMFDWIIHRINTNLARYADGNEIEIEPDDDEIDDEVWAQQKINENDVENEDVEIKMFHKAMSMESFSEFDSQIEMKYDDNVDMREMLCIGILDIFGFEIFLENSLEQFFINYANEKLQQFFLLTVFKREQKEYAREGIIVPKGVFEFQDNKECLDMLESSSNPPGILRMLDEEVVLPKASDSNLLLRLSNTFLKSSSKRGGGKGGYFLQLPRSYDTFIIRHYAGDVEYCINGFVEKNRDKLHDSIVGMLCEVDDPLIQRFYSCNDTSEMKKEALQMQIAFEEANKKEKMTFVEQRRESIGKQTSGNSNSSDDIHSRHNSSSSLIRQQQNINVVNTFARKFQLQLNTLMNILQSSEPHFIRCIKPNDDKEPFSFNSKIVLEQMKYGGLYEALRIRRMGFPYRKVHFDFFQRYKCILRSIFLWMSLKKQLEILKVGMNDDQHESVESFLLYEDEIHNNEVGLIRGSEFISKYFSGSTTKEENNDTDADVTVSPELSKNACYTILNAIKSSKIFLKVFQNVIESKTVDKSASSTSLTSETPATTANNDDMDTKSTKSCSSMASIKQLSEFERAHIRKGVTSSEFKSLEQRFEKTFSLISQIDFKNIFVGRTKVFWSFSQRLILEGLKDSCEMDLKNTAVVIIQAYARTMIAKGNMKRKLFESKNNDNPKDIEKENDNETNANILNMNNESENDNKTNNNLNIPNRSTENDVSVSLSNLSGSSKNQSMEDVFSQNDEESDNNEESLLGRDEDEDTNAVSLSSPTTKLRGSLKDLASISSAQELMMEMNHLKKKVKRISVYDTKRNVKERYKKFLTFKGRHPLEASPYIRSKSSYLSGIFKKRKLLKESIYIHQKETIPKSLVHFHSEDVGGKEEKARLIKVSIENFENMLFYMKDRVHNYSNTAGDSVLMTGIKEPKLRDEIFFQLIKQTRANQSMSSALLGLNLFYSCLCFFQPTVRSIKEVKSHLASYAHDTVPEFEKLRMDNMMDLASLCFDVLEGADIEIGEEVKDSLAQKIPRNNSSTLSISSSTTTLVEDEDEDEDEDVGYSSTNYSANKNNNNNNSNSKRALNEINWNIDDMNGDDIIENEKKINPRSINTKEDVHTEEQGDLTPKYSKENTDVSISRHPLTPPSTVSSKKYHLHKRSLSLLAAIPPIVTDDSVSKVKRSSFGDSNDKRPTHRSKRSWMEIKFDSKKMYEEQHIKEKHQNEDIMHPEGNVDQKNIPNKDTSQPKRSLETSTHRRRPSFLEIKKQSNLMFEQQQEKEKEEKKPVTDKITKNIDVNDDQISNASTEVGSNLNENDMVPQVSRTSSISKMNKAICPECFHMNPIDESEQCMKCGADLLTTHKEKKKTINETKKKGRRSTGGLKNLVVCPDCFHMNPAESESSKCQKCGVNLPSLKRDSKKSTEKHLDLGKRKSVAGSKVICPDCFHMNPVNEETKGCEKCGADLPISSVKQNKENKSKIGMNCTVVDCQNPRVSKGYCKKHLEDIDSRLRSKGNKISEKVTAMFGKSDV